jgi:hypothetical protein
MDLNLFGTALCARWLWLQRMDLTRPWVNMRIVEDRQTMTFFNASLHFFLGNGETFLFWADPWLARVQLSKIVLEVVAAVPARRWRQVTVAAALTDMSWVRDIRGALNIPVLMQYVVMYQRLQGVHLSPGIADRLDWRWSGNGSYSSRSAYAALFLGQAAVLGAKEPWKTKASNKCWFFI